MVWVAASPVAEDPLAAASVPTLMIILVQTSASAGEFQAVSSLYDCVSTLQGFRVICEGIIVFCGAEGVVVREGTSPFTAIISLTAQYLKYEGVQSFHPCYFIWRPKNKVSGSVEGIN